MSSNISITVNSVVEFLQKNDSGNLIGDKFYRGQTNKNWVLRPSLFRMKLDTTKLDKWLGAERMLLTDFKRSGIPFFSNSNFNIVDLICLAQHHGIPTRLLDWTENPLTALFFAVEDENLETDGIVWRIEDIPILDKLPNNYNDLVESTLDDPDDILIYRPNHITKRIIAQNGYFTIHKIPYGENVIKPLEESENVFSNPFFRVNFIIRGTQKTQIKISLDKMGINYATLFPDIDGLCKYLKWKTELKSKHTRFKLKGRDLEI